MNLKHTLQSGRSMVEMLGTLAIIGVLSVGGIVGYFYGMDKYRANETINDVNMRGIDLVRQVATNQAPDLSDWPTVSQAGYTISEANLSADGEAYFSISGMSQRVCEMVYEGIQNNQTTVVKINESTNGDTSDCQSDNNTMTFFFVTTAGGGGVKPEDLCQNVTCQEGYSCTHGICMSEMLPQFHSNGFKYCSSSFQCSECQYCHSEWQYCESNDNGTVCAGGTCYNGKCVLNEDTCTSHDDCVKGYFCDKGDSNKCVKLDWYKIPGNDIYISKVATEDDLCELAGFYSLTKAQMMYVVKELGDSIVSYSAYLHTSDAGGCDRDDMVAVQPIRCVFPI